MVTVECMIPYVGIFKDGIAPLNGATSVGYLPLVYIVEIKYLVIQLA